MCKYTNCCYFACCKEGKAGGIEVLKKDVLRGGCICIFSASLATKLTRDLGLGRYVAKKSEIEGLVKQGNVEKILTLIHEEQAVKCCVL